MPEPAVRISRDERLDLTRAGRGAGRAGVRSCPGQFYVRWDPADYAAHSAPQLLGARELLGRLALRGHERVLDVGCGDGRVTAELAAAVPRGRVRGVDNSAEMIRFARAHYPPERFPNLEFRRQDARALRGPPQFDIVFSNAVLHWVDDHPAFLRGAAACLQSGGRLLVACGGRGNAQDLFTSLRATMRQPRWRAFFRGLQPPYFFHDPEAYEAWLPRFGFARVSVRLTESRTLFADRSALADWLRTTWLPYTQRVPAALRGQFIDAVVATFAARHPPDAMGRLSVRMVRLEIEAVKD